MTVFSVTAGTFSVSAHHRLPRLKKPTAIQMQLSRHSMLSTVMMTLPKRLTLNLKIIPKMPLRPLLQSSLISHLQTQVLHILFRMKKLLKLQKLPILRNLLLKRLFQTTSTQIIKRVTVLPMPQHTESGFPVFLFLSATDLMQSTVQTGSTVLSLTVS